MEYYTVGKKSKVYIYAIVWQLRMLVIRLSVWKQLFNFEEMETLHYDFNLIC